MELFVWNEDLSVGIREIDEQHKVLVGILNKLYRAMRDGKGKDVIASVLNELVEYTDFHFSTEEEYFARFDYPGARRHTAAHGALRKRAGNFKSRFESGEIKITIDVMRFLKEWLTTHIMKSDKLYAPFLIDKGII